MNMEHEFFTKAQENLQAAELLLTHELYNASVNRAYYAVFQAAIAALGDRSISVHIGDRVGHEAVQSSFATELIHRRKVYPNHLKSYLMTLQAARNDADYKPAGISKNIAVKQLKKAQEFIESVRQVIEQ